MSVTNSSEILTANRIFRGHFTFWLNLNTSYRTATVFPGYDYSGLFQLKLFKSLEFEYFDHRIIR